MGQKVFPGMCGLFWTHPSVDSPAWFERLGPSSLVRWERKGIFFVWEIEKQHNSLLAGSLGLCNGLVVVGSTVERTESVLHSASGSTRALERRGAPRKLARGTLVVAEWKCLWVVPFWRSMLISGYLEVRGILKIFCRQDEQCQTGEAIQCSVATLEGGHQGSLLFWRESSAELLCSIRFWESSGETREP